MRHESDSLNAGYCEYLTPVKATGKIIMFRILIIFVAVLLSLIMLTVTLATIPVVSFMALVCIIFVSWYVMQFTKIEYEYIVASGTLELSKIYGQRKRKLLFEIKTSDITTITPHSDINSLSSDKDNILYACNKDDSGTICLAYSQDNVKKVLVISAPEKTINCLKYYRRSAFSSAMNI